MVVFTCNNCGESLKKKDVEKHSSYGKCRNVINLTCVDCLKDFRDDYNLHTACVSEHQRYGATGLNGAVKKTKQQLWVETVHDAVGRAIDDGVPGITGSVRQMMLWLQNQATIPDRPKPFANYIKSARRGEPDQIIEFVWKILEKARQELQAKLQAEREAEKKAKDELKQKKQVETKDSSSEDSDSSDEETEKKGKDTVKGDEKSKKKDKKDKKKRMVSESESVLNGSSEFRKSKKSKRDTQEDDGEENSNLNNALDACHLNTEASVDDHKLSKKERKEKKRREKFEAEMKEIEAGPAVEDETVEEETQQPAVEETEGKKSKKKKNKKNKNAEEVQETPEAPEVDEVDEKKKKRDKKNKKNRKDEEAEPMDTEVSDSKLKNGKSDTCKLNETLNVEDLQNEKFSWDAAILQVLEAEEEISLKKLTKKVCNHYLQSLGEYSQADEITALNKFNKKLHKMHNVLVHKERVKLKTSRD